MFRLIFNKIKYSNSHIISVIVYSLIFGVLNFISNLLIHNNNYYLCNNLEPVNVFKNIIINFPISCDLDEYLVGFTSFFNIFEYESLYQSRPIYLLFINIILKLISLFGFKSELFSIIFSIFLSQVFIMIISVQIFLKTIEIKLNSLEIFGIVTLISINPLFKWGLFDPSNQTITYLASVISLYYLKRTSNLNYKNSYYYSFILGVLYLANKVFGVTFLLLILIINLDKLKVEKNINPYNFILNLFIFISPFLIYIQLLNLLGYSFYDADTKTWGHFYWIILHSNNVVEYGGQWFCQSIPQNFKCYLVDITKTLRYLSIPLIYITISYCLDFLNQKYSSTKFQHIKINVVLITIIYMIFWSLIGWYPPIRFSLYPIGFFLTTLLMLDYLNIQKNIEKVQFLVANISFFLGLNHWNNPKIIEFNIYIYISILIFILLLIRKLFNYFKTV